MDKERLVNEYEAAKILSLKVQTLRNWRSNLCGPAYLKLGRCVRYRIEDLEQFIKERRIVPECKK